MTRKPLFDGEIGEEDISSPNQRNMNSERRIALFIDFENIAIGVIDAKYKKFEVNLLLERLLEKGKIVAKRAYCDWDKFPDYKRELHERYGIVFDRLYTLTNMPIQRFGSMLISKGRFDEYMALLRNAYQESNLDGVMCRTLLSVDWQGFVYDCDFNQMLGLPLYEGHRPRTHLSQLNFGALEGLPIRVADHCYGCTAGQGSSCGGALGT